MIGQVVSAGKKTELKNRQMAKCCLRRWHLSGLEWSERMSCMDIWGWAFQVEGVARPWPWAENLLGSSYGVTARKLLPLEPGKKDLEGSIGNEVRKRNKQTPELFSRRKVWLSGYDNPMLKPWLHSDPCLEPGVLSEPGCAACGGLQRLIASHVLQGGPSITHSSASYLYPHHLVCRQVLPYDSGKLWVSQEPNVRREESVIPGARRSIRTRKINSQEGDHSAIFQDTSV